MAETSSDEIATDSESGSEKLQDLLKEELSRGDAALGRTETKTGILLAVFSPILTIGVAVLPRAATSLAAILLFWSALTLLAVALLLLLWNVRPRLRGSGFVAIESMTDAELAQHLASAANDPLRWRREQLLVVARLGAKKFRILRAATTLVMAALLLAIAAAIASTVAT
ncbi:Pycsar system effector family protein [Saccharopolyspora pogona]|uniref:Pycsar system effector family protein n=1 Tax=Saccharopolyspora pogona TaxID=333966 RepID=UPI001683BB65|nr:Pycsar system effector family protein [Saccharopolyspora pogona]